MPISKTYVRVIVGALICVGMLLVFIRIALVPKAVSDDDLRLLYANHKTELELLRQMFLEDAAKSHWQRFTVVPFDETNARLNGIEGARFEQYMALLKRLGVHSMHGDKAYVHFLVRSVGWAGDGRRQGLAWREKPVPEIAKKYGRFVHIEDGWYVFDLHE